MYRHLPLIIQEGVKYVQKEKKEKRKSMRETKETREPTCKEIYTGMELK